MDAYIIIGNTRTRKASLVRSLTGCFNRSVRDILLQGSKRPHRFYARVGTLQDTHTTIEQFAAEAARARCEATVFCLSPTANRNEAVERAPNLRQYPHAPAAPVNVTARDVRAQFGWV
jgi:hypothetical protein